MGKGVIIGLSNLVYTLLDVDPAPGGTATYLAPVAVPGVISAKLNPNSSNDTLFADNGPYETGSTIGNIQLDVNVADLPLETQAAWLGHSLQGGVLINKSTDIPPWVAVGFKTLKSNGKFRYTWLAKGKFAIPSEDNQTKGDKIAWQTPTVTGNFVKRDCDDEWKRQIDEDHIDYMPSMGATWFNSPYGNAADTVPPVATAVVPADVAVGVAVGSSVVWTFSEALALSTATTGNFMLVKDSDGSNVAGGLAINAARTQVTFTPAAALTAATAYRAIVTVDVTDLAGNKLAAPKVTKFTTA